MGATKIEPSIEWQVVVVPPVVPHDTYPKLQFFVFPGEAPEPAVDLVVP